MGVPTTPIWAYPVKASRPPAAPTPCSVRGGGGAEITAAEGTAPRGPWLAHGTIARGRPVRAAARGRRGIDLEKLESPRRARRRPAGEPRLEIAGGLAQAHGIVGLGNEAQGLRAMLASPLRLTRREHTRHAAALQLGGKLDTAVGAANLDIDESQLREWVGEARDRFRGA